MNTKIIGTGYDLPAFAADNDYLATLVDTSDEWIVERTGIRTRHLVKEETTTSMAVRASVQALERAGMKAEEIDLLIVATITGGHGNAEYVVPGAGGDRRAPGGGF